MAAPNDFLYGDSTPSPLKGDFIAFLRDALDFAVTAMISDARLKTAADQMARASQATEDEIALAEALATDVTRVLESFSAARDGSSLAGRCAARIQQGARDVVQSEAETARTAVIAQRTAQAQSASAEYDAFFKALEALLLRHTLEEETGITFVKLEGGTRYDAQLQCRTPYGLEWNVDLEIPASHPLAHVLRIDRVVERLEVEAPEEGGWITREVKNRPQRLDRLYLMALVVHPSETTIRLRVGADGTGAGFDILLRDDPAQVDLLRVQEGASGTAEAPYRVTGEDVARLRSLRDSLVTMASDLGAHKKSLRDASLEGTVLRALPSPRVLVERIVASIAPTVREIGKRSLAPGELVLKRLLDDSRREEIFVSKKDLARKVQVLPQELRRVFDPLELSSSSSVPPPAKETGLPSVIVAPSKPPPSVPPVQIQQGPPVVPTRIVPASPIPPAPVVADGPARSKTSDRPPRA